MTPESQRIALAKWAGWKFINHRIGPDIVDPASYPWACLSGRNPKDDTMDGLPDYLHDLNAVHELEIKLGQDLLSYSYYWKLCDVVVIKDTDVSSLALVCATASQRCEALLKTLGLWED